MPMTEPGTNGTPKVGEVFFHQEDERWYRIDVSRQEGSYYRVVVIDRCGTRQHYRGRLSWIDELPALIDYRTAELDRGDLPPCPFDQPAPP